MRLDAISKLNSITPMFRANSMANQPAQPPVEQEIQPGFAIGSDGDVHPESRTATKGQKLYLLA